MFIWQTKAEEFHIDCLVPTLKHGGVLVKAWEAISWPGLKLLEVIREKVTGGNYYLRILAYHFRPMIQTLLPGERTLLQDDNNAPVQKFHCVQTWLGEENDEGEHLTSNFQNRVGIHGNFR